MHAVKDDPAVAERTGISKEVAQKFTEHDPGGKLPKHVKGKHKGKRPSQFSLPKERREGESAKMHRAEGRKGELVE